MTANQIAFYKAKTEAEHYARSDAENARHNVSTEAISSESNKIQKWMNEQQAAHLIRNDAINMAHFERMDSETARHNQATEGLTEQQNRIKYLEYVNDRDVNSAKLGISEREVAVKEGNLELEKSKLPFQLDVFSADAALNRAKAGESKSKAEYNKKAAEEKETLAGLHTVQIASEGVKDVTSISEAIRKWVPILGLQ